MHSVRLALCGILCTWGVRVDCFASYTYLTILPEGTQCLNSWFNCMQIGLYYMYLLIFHAHVYPYLVSFDLELKVTPFR